MKNLINSILFTIVVTLFLVFCSTNTLAQNNLAVSGKITDKQTGEPVAFATVSILRQSIGIVTNEYGEFMFYIPKKYASDTISFSSMGYERLLMPVKDFTNKLVSYQISLIPKLYSLDEFEVLAKKKKRLRTKEIIRRAIKNIVTNYPNEPFVLHGYFRDYLKDKGEYINLLEAAIKIEDMGFPIKDFENTKLQILQTRFSPEYEYDQTRNVNFDNENKYIPDAYITPFGGNELSTLRVHDPIRNSDRFSFSFIDIFEKKFIQNHNFHLDSVTMYNDQYVYCINFSKKKFYNTAYTYQSGYGRPEFQVVNEDYRVVGTIYISTDDFAIHKITYTNYYEHDKIQDYLYNFIVEYKKYQEKMYLNYLSFSNYFEMIDYDDSSNFKMDTAEFHPRQELIVINFNHNINPTSLKWATYSIKINNKKIKIEGMRIEDRNKLIFKVSSKGLSPRDYSSESAKITITKLADVSGNIIDEIKTISMYQYREFFVNKIEINDFSPIPYNNTMPKRIPLYLLKKDDDPSFWDTYNIVRSKTLLK